MAGSGMAAAAHVPNAAKFHHGIDLSSWRSTSEPRKARVDRDYRDR